MTLYKREQPVNFFPAICFFCVPESPLAELNMGSRYISDASEVPKIDAAQFASPDLSRDNSHRIDLFVALASVDLLLLICAAVYFIFRYLLR